MVIEDQLVGDRQSDHFHSSIRREYSDGRCLREPEDWNREQFSKWLRQCGVAWVKFPCWLPPDDFDAHERPATTLSKLQEIGIHTVGMLDVPPESEIEKYDVRGRRDLVAAQLFRDKATWQPELEPVMTRLTMKVRTWQIGADRDHSFLGRLRLRDTVAAISNGLQGFGQPIDVAISWPWLEPDSPVGEISWQAVCRSSRPPFSADELNAFLGLRSCRFAGGRATHLVAFGSDREAILWSEYSHR